MNWFIDHPDDLVVIKEIEDPNLSDRALAITAGAFLDDRLESRIRSRMISDKTVVEGMFKKSGPLSSFHSRIELGYLLSLYSDEIRRDLHRVRKIRNDFAHFANPISFEVGHLRDLALAITIINKLEPTDGWLHGHTELKYATVLLGGPERVPENARDWFRLSVRYLFTILSFLPTEIAFVGPEF